jgi:uncharacterized membrane protein YccF (DUF307 family)
LDQHVRLLLNVVWLVFGGFWLFVGNVIWFVLAGWWLVIAHVVSAVALAVTIIGIPLALADLKLIPISLAPLGKDIVPTGDGEFGRRT